MTTKELSLETIKQLLREQKFDIIVDLERSGKYAITSPEVKAALDRAKDYSWKQIIATFEKRGEFMAIRNLAANPGMPKEVRERAGLIVINKCKETGKYDLLEHMSKDVMLSKSVRQAANKRLQEVKIKPLPLPKRKTKRRL